MAVVLLFEPVAALREQLRWLLESGGHRVVLLDGTEAGPTDAHAEVEVAVVDVTDSVGAGKAFAEAFQSDPRHAATALVALTAVRLHHPGADVEVWMPFQNSSLLEAVGKALASRKAAAGS